MKISAHFERGEFACKCGCGFAAADVILLDVLEDIRITFGKPVIIQSGCRCESHNRKVGGAPKSMHVRGMAADIRVTDVEPKEVADYLESSYQGKFGIGRYDTWTHIDVRDEPARWAK